MNRQNDDTVGIIAQSMRKERILIACEQRAVNSLTVSITV